MQRITEPNAHLNLPPMPDADLADAIYALNVAVGLEPAPARGDRHGWMVLNRSQMVLTKLGGAQEVLAWLT